MTFTSTFRATKNLVSTKNIKDTCRTKKNIFIGCNWKCCVESPVEVDNLVQDLNKIWRGLDQACRDAVELSVYPPYVFIGRVRQHLDPGMAVGSQNIYDASATNKSANHKNTGAITETMLSQLGVQWVLLGHSDRRNNLGESDALIAEKAQKVLTCNLRQLKICLTLGELGSQRDNGETEAVLKKQLDAIVRFVPDDKSWSRVALAYEPVWAVGEGATPCPPAETQRILRILRDHLRGTVSVAAAENCRITYTGSVNEDNAASYAVLSEVEGFVLGRAGLDADKLKSIIQTIVDAKQQSKAVNNRQHCKL